MIKRVEYNGMVDYQLNGLLHRPDGPARAYTYHKQYTWYWWMYGKEHRYYGACDTMGYWIIHGKGIKRCLNE